MSQFHPRSAEPGMFPAPVRFDEGQENLDPEYLSVAQLGALVGLKSQATHDLIRRERIPRIVISKRCIRVRRADVDRFLERVRTTESS